VQNNRPIRLDSVDVICSKSIRYRYNNLLVRPVDTQSTAVRRDELSRYCGYQIVIVAALEDGLSLEVDVVSTARTTLSTSDGDGQLPK